MTSKNQRKLGWVSVLLAWMVFGWACSNTADPAMSKELETRESIVTTEKDLPQIDRTAPSAFETASLGLG